MSARSFNVELDEQRIDAIFAQVNHCELPGAAVGIALHGVPLYRKGFGLASMELPTILSPSMRMRIGSITKHFTCLAYLLICEQGKANLDDPLGKYLPELHPVTHQVTIRQLMGHTSGLRDACAIRWQFSGMERALTAQDVLALYRDMSDVNFAPGESWAYNNGAFLLLSMIIERITERSLEEVFITQIFEPVGMRDSLLRRYDTDFVANSATMHMTMSGRHFEKLYLAGPLTGDGGIVSTVDDMLRWLAHMDAPVVGSAQSWAQLRQPQRLTNGASTGYGLGLICSPYRGVQTVFHAGGVRGSNAHMLKLPQLGLDIVVMVNRHDVLATHLAMKIVDACVEGLEPIGMSAQEPFASGTFRSPRTERVIQLYPLEQRQMALISGLELEVAPDAGVLRPLGVWGFVNQALTVVGDRGQPEAIRFEDFGVSDELLAVGPPHPAHVPAIAGRYRADTIGTEATIAPFEGGWTMQTTGRFGSVVYELECIAQGIWRTKPVIKAPASSTLSFARDYSGFRLSNWNTRSLPFERCD